MGFSKPWLGVWPLMVPVGPSRKPPHCSKSYSARKPEYSRDRSDTNLTIMLPCVELLGGKALPQYSPIRLLALSVVVL